MNYPSIKKSIFNEYCRLAKCLSYKMTLIFPYNWKRKFAFHWSEYIYVYMIFI